MPRGGDRGGRAPIMAPELRRKTWTCMLAPDTIRQIPRLRQLLESPSNGRAVEQAIEMALVKLEGDRLPVDPGVEPEADPDVEHADGCEAITRGDDRCNCGAVAVERTRARWRDVHGKEAVEPPKVIETPLPPPEAVNALIAAISASPESPVVIVDASPAQEQAAPAEVAHRYGCRSAQFGPSACDCGAL